MNGDIAVNFAHPDPDGHWADIAANAPDPNAKPLEIAGPQEGEQSEFLGLHFTYRNGEWEAK